jgi:hypothetical protein
MDKEKKSNRQESKPNKDKDKGKDKDNEKASQNVEQGSDMIDLLNARRRIQHPRK